MVNTYKLTIYCTKFPTLKNAKQFRINKSTKRLFIASSDDWAAWYKDALLQAISWKNRTKYQFPMKRCSIAMICFFVDKRNHDLDGIQSGCLDLLKVKRKKDKKTGIVTESGARIIFDDDWKYVRPISIDAGTTIEKPRIEIYITPIEDLSYRTR